MVETKIPVTYLSVRCSVIPHPSTQHTNQSHQVNYSREDWLVVIARDLLARAPASFKRPLLSLDVTVAHY